MKREYFLGGGDVLKGNTGRPLNGWLNLKPHNHGKEGGGVGGGGVILLQA